MEIVKSLLCLTIIKCCCVIYSKSEVVNITLGDPGKELFVENGQPLLIHCILNSGNLDLTFPRSWIADSTTLINDGNPTSAGSGYSETLDTDKFSLSTPPMDLNADGRVYRCNYRFSQTTLTIKINDIGSSDQSKGNCINGRSIKDCWFSFSKVIPGISSPNLTATYIDDMEENITSMLNETLQMNADGKTWDYWYNLVPNFILLKNVKAITLSFMVGDISTSRTITVTIEGCKYSDAELFLGGFSCFLIVFGITSIIMLIFLLCQMLPKIFEDKKTNKIIIIVVFNSFALIFGFALGFGLKECEKRDLGLGLGLGFGFILAIALFLTLYIYHKQCGSKKENEDENRESPPKFNSKKPEDSPKRVGSPASTSNIKMESKLKS